MLRSWKGKLAGGRYRGARDPGDDGILRAGESDCVIGDAEEASVSGDASGTGELGGWGGEAGSAMAGCAHARGDRSGSSDRAWARGADWGWGLLRPGIAPSARFAWGDCLPCAE